MPSQGCKEVILERFPHRSRELDAYLINIIDLATKYTSKAYWQYHTRFAKQAASLRAGGIRVDWSVVDPIILHKAIASEHALFVIIARMPCTQLVDAYFLQCH